jgi:penicillin-binding protein 2
VSQPVRIKDQWAEGRLFVSRSVIGMTLVFLLSATLVAQLVRLQIIRHDYFLDQAQGNRVRRDPIPASRGLIRDRHGTIMVDNQPTYQLELIREQTPNLEDTLIRLQTLGMLNTEQLDQARRAIKARRIFDSVPIRLNLSDEEIGRFAVHRHEFQGVDLRTRQTRHYPFGQLGVHAFGYVSAINEEELKKLDRASYAGTTLMGKLGVEAAYEDPLHGRNGYSEILVNAQGRSVERQGAYHPVLKSEPPVAGRDLMLSIDLPAQRAAEEGLGDRRGAVVALDPSTGDVLVLASRPGFDPGAFGRGLTRAEYATLTENIDKPLLNRALRGAYPSGSTIKPAMALAGLHYGVLDPDKREFCSGEFHLPRSAHMYREGKGGKHGGVNLVDAIAVSCDVYFYSLAATLGVDRIANFLSPFGLGQLSGIDISGERPGLLPTPEWKKKIFKHPADQVWFPGETVNLGVGQGYLQVTPLQLAVMVSVIANRGHSFQPRLLTGLLDAEGKVTPVEPVKRPDVDGVTSEQWDIVLQGMIGATTRGTAAAIGRGSSYPIAGKTGTAQVFSIAQNQKVSARIENERLRDHSWFIAFAPADKPRIAIAVLVENGGFGASVAAPIAKRVMDAYLKMDTGVPPT